MQVVINISDEDYKDLMDEEWISALNDYQLMIRNGKPLPKGHGDLIDRDVFRSVIPTPVEDEYKYIHKLLYDAPVVVPADEGE